MMRALFKGYYSKEIIVLTKSSKHGEYCISGIDTITGEWIRPVSTNSVTEGSVPLKDITYKDGSQVQIFDKVKIYFLSHNPTISQPENWIYNSETTWEKVGISSLEEVIELRGYDKPNYIFYNNDKEVTEEDLSGQNSLLLANVKNSYVFIKTFDGNKRIQFNFEYNGMIYKFFKISDEAVKSDLSNKDDGSYYLRENLPVVFSLTDKYYRTGKYYKMVAQMFY